MGTNSRDPVVLIPRKSDRPPSRDVVERVRMAIKKVRSGPHPAVLPSTSREESSVSPEAERDSHPTV